MMASETTPHGAVACSHLLLAQRVWFCLTTVLKRASYEKKDRKDESADTALNSGSNLNDASFGCYFQMQTENS